MTSPDWIPLDETLTTMHRLRPHQDGGLTLQFLTATEAPGATVVLPVKAAKAFINWVLDAHEPDDEELRDLCRLRGITLQEHTGMSETEWRNIGEHYGYFGATATVPTPSQMRLDEMATILSHNGYLVREGEEETRP